MSDNAVDLAEQVFLDKWYGIDIRDAEFIVQSVKDLSNEQLLVRPILTNAAIVAVQRLTPDFDADQGPLLERFANLILKFPESTIGERLSGVRLRQWRVMEMIARRWRHEYDVALEISDSLGRESETFAAKGSTFSPNGDGLWPGHVSLQRGLTEALAGNLSASMRSFTRAYDEGGGPPSGHYAKANAAANAAMLAALEGNTSSARKWIDRADNMPPVPESIAYLTFVGRDIAKAQLAIDELNLGRSNESISSARVEDANIELWPFLAHVKIAHELTAKRPLPALEVLKAIGFDRDRVSAHDSVADHLIFRSYLDVLVEMGEGGSALRSAVKLGHPTRSLVPVARSHLISGNYVGVSTVSSFALRQPDLSVRDMWEATWLQTLAAAAMGEVESARASLTAIQQADPDMLPAIIARTPDKDTNRLLEATGSTHPVFQRADTRIEPALTKLTPRERHILQLLSDGHSPRVIAEREVISVHTVRTHIKVIYRKLGVSNQQDAIRRANGLVRVQKAIP